MLEFKYIFGENGYKIAEATRKSVFGDELGMSEIRDGLDGKSYHFVGYDKITQIAAARLTQLDEKNFMISYVGIKKDYRRQYVGDLVMRALADKTVTMGGTTITIQTPVSEKGFFEFEGYETVGEEFEAGGRIYIKMQKDLTKIQSSCRGCAK